MGTLPDPTQLDALLTVLRRHGVHSFEAAGVRLDIAVTKAPLTALPSLPRPVGLNEGRDPPTPEERAAAFEAHVQGRDAE